MNTRTQSRLHHHRASSSGAARLAQHLGRPVASRGPSMTAKAAIEDLRDEALSKFMPSTSGIAYSATVGGINNGSFYVTPAGASCPTHVLRVYNNGLDTKRVVWEHDILRQLNGMQLSFSLPLTIPSLADGRPHATLSNGAEACLFQLIPGSLPKLTMVREIGQASGELCAAMARVRVDGSQSPTAPYFDIYRVHKSVTRESFLQTINGPLFDQVREPAAFLLQELMEVERSLDAYHALKLPQQLIHGDLHYDNVLCTEEGVSGLLDFEFAALDWRAMELAICLSKYLSEPEPIAYLDLFLKGFGVHGRLTHAEILAMPTLINLRILSNVVYFVGRYLGQEDDIESITVRAAAYVKRIRWVKENAAQIVALLQQHVPEE